MHFHLRELRVECGGMVWGLAGRADQRPPAWARQCWENVTRASLHLPGDLSGPPWRRGEWRENRFDFRRSPEHAFL